MKSSPRKSQFSSSDVVVRIILPEAAQLDVSWLFRVTYVKLCRLVKRVCDVVYHFWAGVTRALELFYFCKPVSVQTRREDHCLLCNSPFALRVTNTEPWRRPRGNENERSCHRKRTRLTLGGRNLLKGRRFELHRIHTQVEGTTTSVNDDDSLTERIL